MASEPTVLSTTTALASTSLRELLSRNAVRHRWIDLDVDPLARVFDFHHRLDGKRLPVVLFPDGSLLEAPEHYTDFAPDQEDELYLARAWATMRWRNEWHVGWAFKLSPHVRRMTSWFSELDPPE